MLLELLIAAPRRGLRALDDLGVVATELRQLSSENGDLHVLTETARQLPVVEGQLSSSVASLRDDIELLRGTVTPLHDEAGDLDSTAESLEAALVGLQDQINVLTAAVQGLCEDLASLRDRIPGL